MEYTDLEEFELDIQEAFAEIGDVDNIGFKRFVKETTNIYKESKTKKYGSVTTVTGRAKMNPTSEEVSPIGRTAQIEAIFTFVSKDLRELGLLDEYNLLVTLDDRIHFKGQDYSIKNILPSAMLGDRFLVYKFECKKV